MSDLKICVYAICNGEVDFVPRFMEGAKDADLILVCDTGSTDGAGDKLRELGATVYDISVKPWRFDDARNVALGLIPTDIDVCMSLDIDEVLQPGWREEITRVWKKGSTNRLKYKFDWGAGIAFYYDKCHARHGFRWRNMCHEAVYADPRTTEVWAQTEQLLVIHMPDNSKSRGQYMSLLEYDVKENPWNARNAFYHARELGFHRRWAESIAAVDRYLALPEANWINERCYALRVKGRALDELGDGENALKAFRLASIEAPNTREPWVDLAESCYKKSLWDECYLSAVRALRITNREDVYTVDPECWGFKPYDLAAIAAWNMGMKEKAVEYGRLAKDMDPANERLGVNLLWYLGENPIAVKEEE